MVCYEVVLEFATAVCITDVTIIVEQYHTINIFDLEFHIYTFPRISIGYLFATAFNKRELSQF